MLAIATAIICLLLAACGSTGMSSSSTASVVHSSSYTAPAQSVITYDRSCDKTAVSQIAMDDCVTRRLHQVECQLTQALSQEKKSVASGLVISAESLFETFEVGECKAEARPNFGGTNYPVAFGSCELQLTVQRIQVNGRIDSARH